MFTIFNMYAAFMDIYAQEQLQWSVQEFHARAFAERSRERIPRWFKVGPWRFKA